MSPAYKRLTLRPEECQRAVAGKNVGPPRYTRCHRAPPPTYGEGCPSTLDWRSPTNGPHVHQQQLDHGQTQGVTDFVDAQSEQQKGNARAPGVRSQIAAQPIQRVVTVLCRGEAVGPGWKKRFSSKRNAGSRHRRMVSAINRVVCQPTRSRPQRMALPPNSSRFLKPDTCTLFPNPRRWEGAV